MTAQTGGSRTAALHTGLRQGWYLLSNQRCGLDTRKCQSVRPPAREEHGTKARLLSPDWPYVSSLERTLFKFCLLSLHTWYDWGNSKCIKIYRCTSLFMQTQTKPHQGGSFIANLQTYLQRWEKVSEDESVSVLFVQTPQVIIINVNQTLEWLTLGTSM